MATSLGMARNSLSTLGCKDVTLVNDAPVAVTDTEQLVVNSEINAYAPGILANDYDPDGDAFGVVAVNGINIDFFGHGITTLELGAYLQFWEDGSYNYVAPLDAFAHLATGETYVETITYTIEDSGGLSSDGTLLVTVEGISEPPAVVSDSGVTDEYSILVKSAQFGVLANDSDPYGGTLTVAAVNGSAQTVGQVITLDSGALLTLNRDGSYLYNPNGQFDLLESGTSAADSFSYAAANELGVQATATVSITVNGADGGAVNSSPVAVTDYAEVFVNSEINAFPQYGVLANDYDPDGRLN